MLKSIDVLIGLTVVLLALSMAVTVVTQTLTTIVNSRGRHLRRGLVDLLQQLDPQLTAAVSKKVATGILMNPLVSGSNTPMAATGGTGTFAALLNTVRGFLGGPRLGNVVQREEFTKLLMGLACDGDSGQLDDAVKNAVKSALQSNGIENPEQTLKNARQLALQLERSQPELSNMARQNLAILHAAESDLVAKINNWFDQTMDRTSQRFTASTRAITFVGAFIVAFVLQVDTPAIVNRLAADEALRVQLVKEASELYDRDAETGDRQSRQGGRSGETRRTGKTGHATRRRSERAGAGNRRCPGQGRDDASTRPSDAGTGDSAKVHHAVCDDGLIRLPTADGWTTVSTLGSVLGMLLTALLLSLGAPFWYNILGQLLRLRSILAAKDDARRAERQTTETTQGATGAAASRLASAPPALLAGERGDLTAIG